MRNSRNYNLNSNNFNIMLPAIIVDNSSFEHAQRLQITETGYKWTNNAFLNSKLRT